MAHTFGIIAAFAVIGAFIDFWIGPAGQKKVRGWLETWWLKLDYVNIHSFGEKEATLAVSVIDSVFGAKFFSLQRLKSTIIAGIVALILNPGVGLIITLINGMGINYGELNFLELADFFTALALFSISISLTRLATVKAIYLMERAPRLNIALFISLVILQYFALCYWTQVEQVIFDLIVSLIKNTKNILQSIFSEESHLFDLYDFGLPQLRPAAQLSRIYNLIAPDYGDDYMLQFDLGNVNAILGVIVNLGRLFIAFIFLVSYLLRAIWNVVSRLWLRIVEDETPVFTLIFGGIGAIASAIEALYKQP